MAKVQIRALSGSNRLRPGGEGDVGAGGRAPETVEREIVMQIPLPQERATLTVDEVSEILGLSRGTAYEAVRRGQIPALRIGRRIVVPTARLRAELGIDRPLPQEPPAAPTPAAVPAQDRDLAELLAEVVARGIELAVGRGALGSMFPRGL